MIVLEEIQVYSPHSLDECMAMLLELIQNKEVLKFLARHKKEKIEIDANGSDSYVG